jgi:putative IMPACT (imprinted ancient) family translation regulator
VHTTIAAPCSYELVVKKSRFVALAASVRFSDEADAWVREASDEQARHNCFAYRLADGSVRTNGDGEPGGTAGPPIAAAIAGAGLWDVAVLVRRYRLDGGAKLGTGGLVRAYGGAAAGVLECAQPWQVVPHTCIIVSFEGGDTGTVYRILGTYECTAPAALDGGGGGAGGGRMRASFAIPEGEVDGVRRGLVEATQGRVRVGEGERVGSDGSEINVGKAANLSPVSEGR